MANITILGSGGFGLCLALTAYRNGHAVKVWSRFPDEIEAIRKDGEHKQKLPGVPIPNEIELTSSIDCINGSDLVIFGIPSRFVRDTVRLAAPYITSSMIVVNSGKGLEESSLKTLSQVFREERSDEIPLNILTGPSHAEEVGIGVPTTIVAASDDEKAATTVQEILSSQTLRIYISSDVIGCEVGGALKNIIALCAGVCDGLGFGDNTKAALMTRGMNEITKLGLAMGGKRETFSGLSGVGDLIVTCCSMHSRNRRAGILIGEGMSPEEAVKTVGTVEGYYCCQAAWELAHKLGVSMPITDQLHNILFEGGDVKNALSELMMRPRKREWDSIDK